MLLIALQRLLAMHERSEIVSCKTKAQSASPLLPKFTMGDSNARTRTIKLHQTPERTHAAAKTARQGRTPHPAERRARGSVERFERTGYGRTATACCRASRIVSNGS